VLALLRRFVDEFAATVVMVTHDPAAAAWVDHYDSTDALSAWVGASTTPIILGQGHLPCRNMINTRHSSVDRG
jgi:hypothetical protein